MSMGDITTRKEIVSLLLDRGIIVSQDLLEVLDDPEQIKTLKELLTSGKQDLLFLNKDLHQLLKQDPSLDMNFKDFEKAATVFEKTKNKILYDRFISFVETDLKKPPEIDVKIIDSYNIPPKKRDLQDFVVYFNTRFTMLQKILRERQELASVVSIGRLKNKKDIESVAVIGMVKDKQVTKNENIIITLEDNTGEISVLINKSKPELSEIGKDLVTDEVIGIVGVTGKNIIFANNIIQPNIPLTNEFKKSPHPGYAVFISDIHVGSNNFLSEDFSKFITWIKGDTGTEAQQELAKKVKYLFIIGDLVDGVGIFPGQEEEQNIRDVKDQYAAVASFLKQIPPHIHIIACPGNHDAVRLAEPQPIFSRIFSEALYSIPNLILVSNPAFINIGATESFSGFNVLMYHGYSFDYYAANVDSIRTSGGYDRADLIMKFFLKRRHLAPTHMSTPYVPESNIDPLVIDKIPDFLVTGHIHKCAVANYRNITLICGSCWQAKTPFQEKVGHHPEPSRVPIVDLQTRKVKILKFGE